MRAVSLTLVLCLLWLLSSGRLEPFLLGAMVVSAIGVTSLCLRLGTVDPEGHPVHLLPRIVGFWVWLLPRIVRANLAVARLVLGPRAALQPALIQVDCQQSDDLGRTILANCITLTPGTVAVAVSANTIEVHTVGRVADVAASTADLDHRIRAVMGPTVTDPEACQ